MRMKKCKLILVSLLSVCISLFFGSFILENNAAAVELTIPVKPYNIHNMGWRCYNRTTQEYSCTATGPAEIGYIQPDRRINIKNGHYYQIYVRVLTNLAQAKPITNFWVLRDATDNFRYIDYEQVTDDRLPQEWVNPDLENLTGGPYADYVSTTYRITYLAQADVDNFLPRIGNPTSSVLFIVPNLNANVIFDLSPIFEYELDNPAEEMNEKDDEDRSNIESQSDSTDADAQEQGDDASETGTSLFAAFTQLLAALTNVSGDSCTLPAMQVYTLDFGNMNLCQYDIPPQIMALVSIGMVFIIVPLGIHLVRKMIGLYKEITG